MIESLAIASLLTAAAAGGADPFGPCLRELQAQAPRHGVSRAAFARFTAGVQYDPRRALPDTAQPEFTWHMREYLGLLVDERRVADGRRLLVEQAEALAAIQKRLGVDPATVVAVFGVETDYGALRPRHPVVETFVNRACGFPQAGSRFRSEQRLHLFAALQLLEEGTVEPAAFLGSRAGAFGMTQFMPATFLRHRTDIDGDGRADIINSVADALGTTARFLLDHGYAPGLRWALPATLGPKAGAELATGQRKPARSIAQWRQLGVMLTDAPADGWSDATPARLLLLDGRDGPAFLVTANFTAFWHYNRAEAYAFAVGRLADTLRGEAVPPLTWPDGAAALSRDEMRELQQRLIDRGHAAVRADGVPGSITREAVRAEQRRLGWPDTGFIDDRLLAALRAGAP